MIPACPSIGVGREVRGIKSNRRKAMAGLNDLIRSTGQGGSIAKPLLLGLGALLATNLLFGGKGQTASAGAQPTTDTSDPGGVLGGLGGLVNKRSREGLATWSIPGSVPGKISRFRLVNLVRRLAPVSSRHCLRSRASPRLISANNCRRFCPGSLTR